MNRLYRCCGALSALLLLAMFVLIMSNVALRAFGFYINGASEYSGYLMAASFFLSLPYAMSTGRHLKVDLIEDMLPRPLKRLIPIWAAFAGSLAVAYWFYYSVRMTWFSYVFGERSEGSDALPLWIPQLFLALGLGLFLASLVHKFISALVQKEQRA